MTSRRSIFVERVVDAGFPTAAAAVRVLFTITCVLADLAATPLSAASADLVEVARIGGANTDPGYLFGRVTFAAIANDGSVFVADGQLQLIRHYDARGAYIADVGRTGEGPGEHREIKGMQILPSGELVVLSNPNRLTFFEGESGAHLRNFIVRSLLSAPRMLECDHAGFVYVKDVDGNPPMNAEWPKLWLKIDGTGRESAVIPIPLENQASRAFVLIFPEGSRENFVVATKSALSMDGHVISGRNDRYAFDINRDPPVHTGRKVEPVDLNKHERSEWQAWAEKFGRGGETYEIPKVKPAYREIYVDIDGLIWVHRYVAARKVDLDPRPSGDDRPLSTWREPNTFDVFDASGVFLWTVELPMLVRAAAFRGTSIWGVDSTDDGEQLVRWRVSVTGQ